jgi:hypothetical protein
MSWFARLMGVAALAGVAFTTTVPAAAAGPAIYAMSPNHGPVAGNQGVRIFGTGFDCGTGVTYPGGFGLVVTFGKNAGTIVTVQSDNAVDVTTPKADAAGTVDVTITCYQGNVPGQASSPDPNDRYIYDAPGAASGGSSAAPGPVDDKSAADAKVLAQTGAPEAPPGATTVPVIALALMLPGLASAAWRMRARRR